MPPTAAEEVRVAVNSEEGLPLAAADLQEALNDVPELSTVSFSATSLEEVTMVKCPATCALTARDGQTASCDDWILTNPDHQCPDLEAAGCDCTGCQCWALVVSIADDFDTHVVVETPPPPPLLPAPTETPEENTAANESLAWVTAKE